MTVSELIAKLKSLNKPSHGKRPAPTPRLVLSILLVVVLLADIWLVQSAFRAIYQYKFSDVGARLVQSTRVNFEGFSKASNRIEQADSYRPAPAPAANPFKEVDREE
jgi:hypothetical protein